MTLTAGTDEATMSVQTGRESLCTAKKNHKGILTSGK